MKKKTKMMKRMKNNRSFALIYAAVKAIIFC